jgi:hypothetical protein
MMIAWTHQVTTRLSALSSPIHWNGILRRVCYYCLYLLAVLQLDASVVSHSLIITFAYMNDSGYLHLCVKRVVDQVIIF